MSYCQNSFELYFTATLVRKSTGVLIFQKQTNNHKTPLLIFQVFYGFDYIRVTKTSNTSLHYMNIERLELYYCSFTNGM